MKTLCMPVLILGTAYFVSFTSLLLILLQLLLHLSCSLHLPLLPLCQPMDSSYCFSMCKMETEQETNTGSNIWYQDHNHSRAVQEDKVENMWKRITIGWMLWVWKWRHRIRSLWLCSCFQTRTLLNNEDSGMVLQSYLRFAVFSWSSQDRSENT